VSDETILTEFVLYEKEIHESIYGWHNTGNSSAPGNVPGGRGLGASGGIKYCVVSVVGAVDRPHADRSIYYSKYFEDGRSL